MSDIRIDASGDLDLTDGSASLAEGEDAIVQRLRIFLAFFVGDWFLALNFGIPYVGRVLIRGVNEGDLLQLFASKIRTVPGVVGTAELNIDTGDSDNRTMTLTGTVLTDSGDEVEFTTLIPSV